MHELRTERSAARGVADGELRELALERRHGLGARRGGVRDGVEEGCDRAVCVPSPRLTGFKSESDVRLTIKGGIAIIFRCC